MAGVIGDDPAATFTFGVVHGGIGIAQNLFGVGVAGDDLAVADACGHGDGHPAEHDGFFDDGEEPLGGAEGLSGTAELGEHDGELIASESSEDLAGAEGLLEALRHLDEEEIAEAGAEHVVDGFEAVEVHVENVSV